MSQPIRIAVLHFQHETVTFLRNDTTIDDFVYPGSPARGEALLASAPKSYMGGFVQVARESDGAELVGIESPLWPKTGTGSGWVAQEAYETYVGRMITQLTAEGPFDGVYLCVHGAMGARGIPRPEAELARRARAVVGPRAFITATFDPHGNEDEEFLRHADLAFCGKYFPHYDSHLQGQRAARMLICAIKGQYRSTHATKKAPILSPTVVQWTGASPWMDLVQRALTWEAREPDVYVNVYFGFPWSDVPNVGMTIQVLTNDDAALARHVADDMASFAWRQRDKLLHSTKVHTISEGITLTKQAIARGDAPVVLAYHSDRSGYATWLLKEIVEKGLSNTLIATVADAEAIKTLNSAKVGDAFDMPVGGLVDESAGEKVRITGAVRHVVLSPYLVQIMELTALTELGLDLAAFQVIAIKSRVHFRRGFDDSGFAKTILLVEPTEPFLGTVRLDALPYVNVDLARFYPFGSLDFSVAHVPLYRPVSLTNPLISVTRV